MGKRVAIVGAGMAGLSAARALRDAGADCTVFEKSRGLGGRMATRRVGELQFDHGAQYFNAKGKGFAAIMHEWREAGCAAEWFDGAIVGAPAMTAPARHMAAGIEVVTGCELHGLSQTAQGWTLLDANGPIEAPGFSTVLFALPAPQIAPILSSACVAFDALAKVRFAPCWALMLGYARRFDMTWTHLRDDASDLPWISRDATKPQRGGDHETFVVHASANWSRRFLEITKEEAAVKLRALFRERTGIEDEPNFVAAHRWRYALVEEPAGEPCLWNGAARLGACGDWCLGARVEAAWESGEAMARAYLLSEGVHNA